MFTNSETRIPVAYNNSNITEQYLPHFFYEEEMEALFKTVSSDAKKGLRDRVILELLYATGIRVYQLHIIILI